MGGLPNNAKLLSEKKICKVQHLNDADVRMATVYNIVIRALPMGSRDAEKELQVEWLKERNRCGGNTECISATYKSRQNHLDGIIQNRILNQGPF